MRTLRLPGRLESLERARDFVSAQAAQAGLPDEKRLHLDLIVEEIVVNQIRHAYRDREGEIVLECFVRSNAFHIRFSDTGPAFDPLAHPPPDTSAPLEERPVGGLGIHLVRQTADRVRYRRQAGRNRLTVTFRFPPIVYGGP